LTSHWEKQPLKELLKMSEKLIRLTVEDFDYQMLCDDLHSLTGAKFSLINIFDESLDKAETVALSGISDNISQAAGLLGFRIQGASWNILSGRIGQLKGGNLILFNNLYDASAGNVSRPLAAALEKALNLGKTYAVEIADAEGKALGEVAIVMGRGEEIQHPEAVEIYTGQVGLLLTRLKAEEAFLKEQREKELILDNLSEQVSFMDNDMRLVWANRNVRERHNVGMDDYKGRICYELFHGYDQPCPGCSVPRALETGRVETGITVSPDGLFWNLTSSPVYKEDEGMSGVLHFAYDVTDLKTSEAELKKLNRELEKRVEERTEELKYLIHELDAFTYSVSHDLRAPLRSIEGFSRAILEDYSQDLDPEGRQYFERITDAVDRMRNLIDDLLKLSQVTRHEINQRKVNLSRQAEIHIKELQEKEPYRDVQVVIDPDVYVYGDQALLEIALANLLDNAWKFTAGVDGASIKFGSQNSSEGIICYVQDQGVGFDQAFADKLFSPFQRLHSQERYPGTGIGLSIVSRVVRRHGGDVWAEGQPGQGATFYFKLPQKEDRA